MANPPDGIDLDPPHVEAVDDDAAVAGRLTGEAVAAAPHGDGETPFAREMDRPDHVRRIRTAHDGGRPPVDRRVPHGPRVLVLLVTGEDEGAAEL